MKTHKEIGDYQPLISMVIIYLNATFNIVIMLLSCSFYIVIGLMPAVKIEIDKLLSFPCIFPCIL